ncbi:MAG: tRNA epoxyqueuosine(34) reductase QueG, partial [Actinomycetota bacterium]|nr:tRNA epoxyqueuosine(34) reductase QueG [Actinomycetota bacterium]
MASPLLDELRAAGLTAGADAVSVASAAPLPEARAAIEDRKGRGLHGGMHFTYGRPERSCDPGRILPGAASIVVALRRYDGGEIEHGARDAAVGRYVARDEYGQLAVALEAMADVLRRSGAATAVVMDDNRLVDRAIAQRAGLGWLGRNTMLLHPDLGSWTVIGSVVTDAVLDADREPVDDGCGDCHRCQSACPTGALDESGVLDATRCLGWLLQAAGRFPVEYRTALGRRLYGCDDCQEVCPVNDDLQGVPVEVEAAPRSGPVDVVALLEADDDELMRRHSHWFIPRRRPEYLRRNALIVLANTVLANTGDAVGERE